MKGLESTLLPKDMARMAVAYCKKCKDVIATSVANTAEERITAQVDLAEWHHKGFVIEVIEYIPTRHQAPERCACKRSSNPTLCQKEQCCCHCANRKHLMDNMCQIGWVCWVEGVMDNKAYMCKGHGTCELFFSK